MNRHDHDDDDDDEYDHPCRSTELHDDEDDQLPFAVGAHDEVLRISSASPQQQQHNTKELDPLRTPDTISSSFHSVATTQVLPELAASSVISNSSQTTNDSSCCGAGGSFLVTDSQYLDAAASLLLPTSSFFSGMTLQPSHTAGATATAAAAHESSTTPRLASAGTVVAATSPPGFSFLLEQADNRSDAPSEKKSNSEPTVVTRKAAPSGKSKPTARLPALPEESLDHQSVTSATESSLILEGFENLESGGYAEPQHKNTNWSFPTTTAAAAAAAALPSFRTSPAASSSSFKCSDERRLASLAGATAVTTGDNAFTVAVELQCGSTTITDVLDVLGNPDFLRLWCDPIRSLVIVSSSEGARNAAERRQQPSAFAFAAHDRHDHNDYPSNNRREYEGEWIEATSPGLVSPGSSNGNGGDWMLWQQLPTLLGFPTYGKVTMFVERVAGRVGLTLGPFPGDIHVSHKLRVTQLEGSGKIRIEDSVRLRKSDNDDEDGNCIAFCGIFSVLQRCFLPTTEDYIDQVLSSMARLRFLVENGEAYVSCSPFASSSSTMAAANNVQTEPHSPLLVRA